MSIIPVVRDIILYSKSFPSFPPVWTGNTCSLNVFGTFVVVNSLYVDKFTPKCLPQRLLLRIHTHTHTFAVNILDVFHPNTIWSHSGSKFDSKLLQISLNLECEVSWGINSSHKQTLLTQCMFAESLIKIDVMDSMIILNDHSRSWFAPKLLQISSNLECEFSWGIKSSPNQTLLTQGMFAEILIKINTVDSIIIQNDHSRSCFASNWLQISSNLEFDAE